MIKPLLKILITLGFFTSVSCASSQNRAISVPSSSAIDSNVLHRDDMTDPLQADLLRAAKTHGAVNEDVMYKYCVRSDGFNYQIYGRQELMDCVERGGHGSEIVH